MFIYAFWLLAVLLGSTAANDRKRKSDWMQQHVEFGNHLSENGPIAKVSSKDRDRRKNQGELINATCFACYTEQNFIRNSIVRDRLLIVN